MSWVSKFGGPALALFACAACNNSLQDFPDKTTESYRLDSAREALDNLDFESAVRLTDLVLGADPTSHDGLYLSSLAHAGRAGLRILDLFNELGSGLSSKTLFAIFAEHFNGATDANVDDIEVAAARLEQIGARAANRTASENFYGLFLYYSRIGVIINRYGYDTNNVQRTNFRACHTIEDLSGPLTGIPNDMVSRIALSVPRLLDTIPALGTASGLPAGALDLSVVPSGVFDYDAAPCVATPNDPICLAARELVGNSHIGLNTGELPLCGGATTP